MSGCLSKRGLSAPPRQTADCRGIPTLQQVILWSRRTLGLGISSKLWGSGSAAKAWSITLPGWRPLHMSAFIASSCEMLHGLFCMQMTPQAMFAASTPPHLASFLMDMVTMIHNTAFMMVVMCMAMVMGVMLVVMCMGSVMTLRVLCIVCISRVLHNVGNSILACSSLLFTLLFQLLLCCGFKPWLVDFNVNCVRVIACRVNMPRHQ